MSAALYLKKHEEKRLKGGHLWIYSNEIDSKRSPLKQFQPGQQVTVFSDANKPLGNAYINPQTLISARLFSRDAEMWLDRSLLVHRLKVALSLRERLFAKPFYRLIHGDSDNLPGLVVDRFADYLVVQITTAGMEAVREAIIEALDKVIKPQAILFKNDVGVRQLEGLNQSVEVVMGEFPEQLELEENDTRFVVTPLTGQKTGWFYDHRMNRARMMEYVSGKRVLDLFSYVGGWGIQAARAGAEDVLCVDASEGALEQMHASASLNGLDEKVASLQGDVFEALKALRADRERFDVVILDPPAFIKRKKDMAKGEQAYERVNRMAMQVLNKDGILISASCSHHLHRDRLPELMLKAARHVDRDMQLLEEGHQGPDHPIHPAIPETRYIKSFTARVLPVR
ncbi:MAG: class I SAM-dependent rRNA methyltransferase [Gammaproteobacteria bacterium]|nr:class I SAM-dependent rRNA methyltransferase [Gammaproteobacteria bacterium]